MKIGFSFGRCVGSIVRGEVKIEEVVCIVARTRMATEDQLRGVIREYCTYGNLVGLDVQTCMDVGLTLYTSGKLHQPRMFDAIVPLGAVEEEYTWMDLYPTTTAHSDSVRDAWDTYRMLLNLTESVPENPEHL
tara:strand:- start:7 stop:405 length:399 start_codon:yes stop_codon:yes gene_type:complete